MKITVLVEDRQGKDLCEPEHGLSLLIEHKEKNRLLMDFGQTGLFIRNAAHLGIDLDTVSTLVLSHGHYDHGNGLEYLRDKTVFCHPDAFRKRYSIAKDRYLGIPDHDVLTKNNISFAFSDEPIEILPDIFFITSIPRLFEFEAKTFPSVLEDGSVDQLFDDGGIIINEDDGITVISGCAHSGICNTVEYARTITGNDTVKAVIGGFHLRETNKDLDQVIDYFRELRPAYLLTGHCTCDAACSLLQQRLSDIIQLEIMGSGNIFKIN